MRARHHPVSILLVLLFLGLLIGPPTAGALDWMDESYQPEGWLLGAAPVGFGSAEVRTELEPGATTYYLRTLFELPSEDDMPALQALRLTVHCSEGVVAYIHSREIGRSPTLPEGELSSQVRASAADPDGVQEMDASFLLTDCENGWFSSLRSVALEVHRVDPAGSELVIDASIEAIPVGSGEPMVLMAEGVIWDCFGQPERPEKLPVPVVWRIRRPLLGMPAVGAAGDPIEVVTSQVDSSSGWRLFLAGSRGLVELPPPAILGNDFQGQMMETMIPIGAPPGLYDLWVFPPLGAGSVSPASVGVLAEGNGTLSAVHLTDSHVPFRGAHARHNLDDFRNCIEACDRLGADLVIHTGDGYNEGDNRDQAELFRLTLEEFSQPVVYTPGNHELGEWCNTGEARRASWELFGWTYLDPTREEHQGLRTRNFVLDVGPLSFFMLESWIHYTDHWWPEYGWTSVHPEQVAWLREQAALRGGQSFLGIGYHEDFSNELEYELDLLDFDLSLSGHTHSADEWWRDDTLFLKTQATYGHSQPVRWLRIQDGALVQYPSLRTTSVARTREPPEGSFSWTVEHHITSGDSTDLWGLKLWTTMPPGVDYQVTGGRLLGQWDAHGRRLVGVEYDLDSFQEHSVRIEPASQPPELTFWLEAEPVVCRPGDQLRLAANLINNGAPREVTAYVVLETGGGYYFFPDWGTDPVGLPLELPTLELLDHPLLEAVWPELEIQGERLRFLSILVDPVSGEALTPLRSVDLLY